MRDYVSRYKQNIRNPDNSLLNILNYYIVYRKTK